MLPNADVVSLKRLPVFNSKGPRGWACMREYSLPHLCFFSTPAFLFYNAKSGTPSFHGRNFCNGFTLTAADNLPSCANILFGTLIKCLKCTKSYGVKHARACTILQYWTTAPHSSAGKRRGSCSRVTCPCCCIGRLRCRPTGIETKLLRRCGGRRGSREGGRGGIAKL